MSTEKEYCTSCGITLDPCPACNPPSAKCAPTVECLQKAAHVNSYKKGWWQGVEPGDRSVIPEKLCLIHSEVSEALEDYRDGHMEESGAPGDKPCGFPSELADIVIRIFDLAEWLGIDLQGAIERKMAYNATRPHRHGGKTC